MKFFSFARCGALASIALTLACSGAAPVNLGGTDGDAAPPGTDVPSDPGAPSPTSSGGAAASPPDAGARAEAGMTSDSGCAGGTLEVEPNDTAATASPLSGTVCGAISPGTAVDFFKFSLSASTRHLHINWHGNLVIKLTVAGETAILSAPQKQSIPFVMGKEYLLEVTSMDGQPQAYNLTLTET